MATLQQIKDAVDQLLGLQNAGQLLQLNSNTRERAFEAYILALCARAVRRAGGAADLVGIVSGLNPNPVVFRGGPGQMWSRDQDFCYVQCQLHNKAFEIHVDVTYEGQSGANHEIDVSIVDAAHAGQVRLNRRSPKTNKNLIAAVECKFYDSTPGVALVRTFVGMLRDCSPNRFNAFVANRTTDGVEKFLSRRWASSFTDMSPLNPRAERRFVSNLEQELRQWSNTP